LNIPAALTGVDGASQPAVAEGLPPPPPPTGYA
jgi:hypothetical protein